MQDDTTSQRVSRMNAKTRCGLDNHFHAKKLLHQFLNSKKVFAWKILHNFDFFCPKLPSTMPISTTVGDILTIKQVADYLKVTERTIYRLAAAKKIPAFKVGGTWRFSKLEIDQWIKQQSVATDDRYKRKR